MELQEARKQIDDIDSQLVELITKRMAVCSEIAAYKQKANLPVRDPVREAEKIKILTDLAPDFLKQYIPDIFNSVMSSSRAYQEALLKRK